MREHLETFLAEARRRGRGQGLPHFVERELREFLTCGVMARGFARFYCSDCLAGDASGDGAITIEDFHRSLSMNALDSLETVAVEGVRHLTRLRRYGSNHQRTISSGRDLEEGGVWQSRHAFAPPAGDIGDNDIGPEMHLGFEQDPPTTRLARAMGRPIKTSPEIATNTGSRPGVRKRRTRRGVQLAVEDLGHHSVENLEQVFIGGAAPGRASNVTTSLIAKRRVRPGEREAHMTRSTDSNLRDPPHSCKLGVGGERWRNEGEAAAARWRCGEY